MDYTRAYNQRMKSGILTAGILLASFAWAADEVGDRAAIEKAVRAMAPLASDFDGYAELAQLSVVADKPRVVISKEPWGEAQVVMPGTPTAASAVVTKIRFMTPTVAVVDAASVKASLFIVLRKEETGWKIASLRILAP
jgi:hypothetical protein